MIYFLRCGAHPLVKIGYTDGDLQVRIEGLSTGNPFELIPLGVIEDGKFTENQLHKRFAPYHVKGEWFRLSTELQVFIDRNAKPHTAKDSIKKRVDRAEKIINVKDKDDWEIIENLIKAVSDHDTTYYVRTRSDFVNNVLKKGTLWGWKKRGWRDKKDKLVQNQELWNNLTTLLTKLRCQVKYIDKAPKELKTHEVRNSVLKGMYGDKKDNLNHLRDIV
jgi:hypothetical protein